MHESTEIKCDSCRNYFHTDCIETKNGTTANELIVLCSKCTNENKIYTLKDVIEIRSRSKHKNDNKRQRKFSMNAHQKLKKTSQWMLRSIA